MSWDFAAQEALEAVHARHLAEVMRLLDRPLRTLEALRAWRDEVAALQHAREGADTVTVAPPSPPVTAAKPQGARNLTSCARGIHSWGAIDHNGWATCAACGQVSITGGSAANGGVSGAYDYQPATRVTLP